MVYVLNIEGKPLMPCKEVKARHLLKDKKAKIIRRTPFTIQLNFICEDKTQDINLGIDAGSKYVGLSACTEKKELFVSELWLRDDAVAKISARRSNRTSRRLRKKRHRQQRYDNRAKARQKGWLAPSIKQKLHTYLKEVEFIYSILPITKIIIEASALDIDKIKEKNGDDFTDGIGFYNIREYVLYRDDYTCQYCKGASGDKVLNVHHIISRGYGGNSSTNLITLCKTCHNKYHKGLITLPEGRFIKRYKDSYFMSIVKTHLYNDLVKIYRNVGLTYGYITKSIRIANNLEKSHMVDARCISGYPLAEPNKEYFYQRAVREHDRKMHQCTIYKGGIRKHYQLPRYVKGYRLFDKILYNGEEYYILTRRAKEGFCIGTLDGSKKVHCVTCKKFRKIETKRTLLIERHTRQICGNNL